MGDLRSLTRQSFSDGARTQSAFITFTFFYAPIGKPYTGCTENLEERFERHMNGYVPATENRRPVQLITHIAFHDKYKAFKFEKYLKSGSGRAFIKKHFS